MAAKKTKQAKKDVDQPAWKQHQGKNTKPVKREATQKEVKGSKPGFVRLKMITSYRHFAKAGDVWETDETKAKELVDLGRAEYADRKMGATKR